MSKPIFILVRSPAAVFPGTIGDAGWQAKPPRSGTGTHRPTPLISRQTGGQEDGGTRGPLRLRRGTLQPWLGAGVRALLPLPRLPAADRDRLRPQRLDRARPGAAPFRRDARDPGADR